MKIIQNNPYRIAGILSNASAKELQKQKAKILAHARVGKEVQTEYDFDFLKPVSRTNIELVENAFSSIEQNQDKVHHAIFWFLNASPFDDTAIGYLKTGNDQKAIEIWEKVTFKEVNPKNFSAFNNLGTFKLLSESEADIKEGIEAKVKLIESDCFKNFVHTVADETFIIDTDREIAKLIEVLLNEIKGQYTSLQIFQLFNNTQESTKKHLLDKLTSEPIHSIETRIEATKSERKNDKEGAYGLGLILFNKSVDQLSLLKSLLGKNDLKYKMIADNLAKEIMQCGIDYFQAWEETKDPSTEGLELLKYAQKIAEGTQTKDRVKENIEGIEEWAETAPINADMKYISRQLDTFQSLSPSIENASNLVSNCSPKLLNIRNILESSNELSVNISSAVVGNALGMIIEIVNQAQSGAQYNQTKLAALPAIITKAISAIEMMDSLDKNYETQRFYNQNKATINKIKNQLSGNSGGGGCYIATMAYGDYDHPQVLELRKFRDDFLSKRRSGRRFIKFYYKHSPRLVEKLKHKQRINLIIQKGLNLFIKSIKKS